MIELRLLGPVDVSSPDSGNGPAGGRLLAQSKRLGLLAYLAAARPRGLHQRDTLLGLFWPELDQEHARAALRNALHFLRRELGNGRVVTRGDTVRLEPAAFWCDVAEFDSAFDARAPERAVTLYRGHFLEGLHLSNAPEFDRWVYAERERLRRRAHDAAVALAHDQVKSGDDGAAARWMRTALEFHPDNESCLQELLRLLDSTGDRAGALHEFDRFAGQLSADYAAKPSPETIALVAEIRSRHDIGTRPGRLAADRPRASVVVLPFETLNPEPETEQFSEGLIEEVIVSLSATPELRVIARSSSARLKGTLKNMRAIGRDLNVTYAVEGTVRIDGDRLRVTARLVDTATQSVIWSETYAASPADVFEVQERLARAIATGLKVGVSENDIESARSRHHGSIQAYNCYHRAIHDLNSYSAEGLDRAVRHVGNGLAVVGENALLLATMAYAHVSYVELGLRPDSRYLDLADEYARHAVRVTPGQPLAHTALGMVRYKRGEITEAVASMKTALDGDPNQPEALLRLALIYLISGREYAAGPLLDRLLAVDPLSSVNHCLPGYAVFLQGMMDAAIPAYRRMHAMDPGNPVTRWLFSLVLSRCGLKRDALLLLDEIIRDTPETTFARHAAFLKHAIEGKRAAALGAATSQLKAEARSDQHASWWMAGTYGILGECDAALEWLENAVRLGYINYPFLSRFDPFLESLRRDARFGPLMEQVKDRWQRFLA